MVRHPSDNSDADQRMFRLFAARCLMRDRLPEPPDLRELAQYAGMSRFHFLRLFRETFGATPHRVSTELRLARARELLVETNLPVTEICFECGYESLGSFSHRFRSAFGCSPRQYRMRRRPRFWPVNITFLHALVPFCLLDVFRGADSKSNFREVF